MLQKYLNFYQMNFHLTTHIAFFLMSWKIEFPRYRKNMYDEARVMKLQLVINQHESCLFSSNEVHYASVYEGNLLSVMNFIKI